MIDLQLNSLHDLNVEGNDLVLIEDDVQVSQNLDIKLQFFKGEYPLDITFGIPYFENVFVKNPDIPAVSAIFKASIMSVPDVNELLEFSLDYDASARDVSLTFKVNTTFGIIAGSI